MLKHIPANLSSDLFKILMDMGHGDEIVFADANFPAHTLAQRLVVCPGAQVKDLLASVLPFFPLYENLSVAACVMDTEGTPPPAMWNVFESQIKEQEEGFPGLTQIERFAFYEQAQKAYAVVLTGDFTPRGNVILKKGVVRQDQAK